jgi:hypothetical protein
MMAPRMPMATIASTTSAIVKASAAGLMSVVIRELAFPPRKVALRAVVLLRGEFIHD